MMKGVTQAMRFSITLSSLLRRVHAARKIPEAGRRPLTGLGRAVQDAIDWTAQSRERRKRLGLE
jgi:hypothetical protein